MCLMFSDDVPMMRHLVVDENFQDMDQNRDGQISADEYLGMFAQSMVSGIMHSSNVCVV